jgi:hypothetical protein
MVYSKANLKSSDNKISLCFSLFLVLRSFIKRIRPGPRPLVIFRDKLIFYGEELLAPRPTPKLEDHPFLTVRDCLFNVFAVTLHICRPSSPSTSCGRALP